MPSSWENVAREYEAALYKIKKILELNFDCWEDIKGVLEEVGIE